MRPGRLLIGSTANESSSVVIPFQCLFLRSLRWVLSTGDLPGWDEQKNKDCSQSCLNDPSGHCGLLPVLGKPLILCRLVHSHDGSIAPSTTGRVRPATHHRSWLAAFPSQDDGWTAFFPASRIDDRSLPWGKCCLPSIWQERNARLSSEHQLSKSFATHPPCFHGFA